MINVEEARNIISTNIRSLDPVTMPLAGAFNHVLAEDVFSATDIPPFPQSAMDGYAFRFEDLLHQPSYLLKAKYLPVLQTKKYYSRARLPGYLQEHRCLRTQIQ
jgi:molybdopterin biosynthesis enzyme